MKILSILTPTLSQRNLLLNKLRKIVEPQLTDQVEWLFDFRDPQTTIGAKRQSLLEKSNAVYCSYLDDDDEISPDYVKKVLEAIKTYPDVVGIKGLYYKDGIFDRPFIHSIKYKQWKNTIELYERSPNHLNIIKRELSLKIGFQSLNFGEDKNFSDLILPFLKTEVMIDEPIYKYFYRTKVSSCNQPSNKFKIITEKDLC